MITPEEKAYAAKVLRGQVAPPNPETVVGQRLNDVLQRTANYLMTPQADNIVLDYRLHVLYGEEMFHCPNGAEFFMDEHGIQWVKFFPSNGYNIGKEHIRRTEGLTIVVDDISKQMEEKIKSIAGSADGEPDYSTSA